MGAAVVGILDVGCFLFPGVVVALHPPIVGQMRRQLLGKSNCSNSPRQRSLISGCWNDCSVYLSTSVGPETWILTSWGPPVGVKSHLDWLLQNLLVGHRRISELDQLSSHHRPEKEKHIHYEVCFIFYKFSNQFRVYSSLRVIHNVYTLTNSTAVFL